MGKTGMMVQQLSELPALLENQGLTSRIHTADNNQPPVIPASGQLHRETLPQRTTTTKPKGTNSWAVIHICDLCHGVA